MKAKELDRKFDEGEDLFKHFDLNRARRVKQTAKRVNVDFASWMIHSLDKEAGRLGVTHQSIIKVWISERLKERSHSSSSIASHGIVNPGGLPNREGGRWRQDFHCRGLLINLKMSCIK
jgi:hypothetical protein